jgi:ribosomal protein L12E/L44/L45/RPP1/RPP2
MAFRSNVFAFKSSSKRKPLDDKVLRLVAECRKVVGRTLPKLVSGLFEKLDDSLYELADKSDTNQLQTAYFDAMRTVRKQRARIQTGFPEAVLHQFDRFWKEGPQHSSTEQKSQDDGELNLALIDEEELEQSLAINNVVSKGENRYRRELFTLSQRFGHLAGGVEVDAGNNPLGPAAICGSFRHALGDLEVDTPVLLVIYKQFDRQVMNYIGDLYAEINSLIARTGMLPKPTRQITNRPAPRRPSSGDPRQAATDPVQGEHAPAASWQAPRSYGVRSDAAAGPDAESGGYGGAAGGYGADTEDFGVALFNTLRDLLGNYRAQTGGTLPSVQQTAHLPVVGTSELLSALSSLQRDNPDHAVTDDGQWSGQMDLRSRLNNELQLEHDGEATRVLGKADEDTLDVISMLFEFVLGDPNLPDALKALLARLQIPMLKVAILDKDFFSRKMHPARRLLNNLARAAMGWSDDGDRSENSLYGHIATIVDQVVNGYIDDPSLLEKLSEEFTAYMDRERRGAELVEERANQVNQGKEQLQLARKMVSEEIQRRAGPLPRLPRVVQTLLEEGWKDVLLLSYLRQGPDSGTWEENLRITDRLLWSVEPKGEYEQRQELLRAIPDLLRQLREGLSAISYDQHKMTRVFKELQACHIACLRAGGKKGAAAAAEEQAAAESQAEAEAQRARDDEKRDIRLATDDDSEEIRHDQFTEMAEDLPVGSWLELREEDGRQVRVKLSWKSDVSDVYVFVNRKGAKMLELTRVDVAKLFRNQMAKILDDVNVPIMDRALDAMLATLKNIEKGLDDVEDEAKT